MKFFLTWLLLLPGCAQLLAQPAAPLAAAYTNTRGHYQLRYPPTWQQQAGPEVATFTAGPGCTARLTVQALPENLQDARLTQGGRPDSALRRVRQLPRVQVLHFEQQPGPDELRYEYTYATGAADSLRQHVYGRQLWQAGYEFRVEYRGRLSTEAPYLTQGRQLVESFAFTGKPLASRRYADQLCDDKLYGIAALRYTGRQWEDDCRTIHEFANGNLSAAPRVHRRALPFQSYALAKGFDNCLYAVTKAPTNAPELVYRYDPATRQGRYTTWRLPAQGPETVWISAATDEQGLLYFLTSDASLLVKVSPYDGTVTTVWTTDPMRRMPFYPEIGFPGAGTHANFCLDDANTMYQVYSTDGSLLKVDLKNNRALPTRLPLTGLPARGGYSGLLLQNDAAGRRRLYLAGPHALYQVDLARQRATRVRGGVYTDLAGCNLFRVVRPPAPPPPPPGSAVWQGRVLDARTGQPLPQAQLRLTRDEVNIAVLLTPQANFSYVSPTAARTYQYHAQLAGYFPTDSAWQAAPGLLVQDVLLRPLAVGTTQQLASVQFEQGRAALLPTSNAALTRLTDLLIDNPAMTIELLGHTDNVGPAIKNVVLSQQRVAAVKAYLTSHGVAAARVSGQGLGGAQPVASNEQEETRRLNRRVEFRITGL